ncbi:MAG: hypothetical protein ABIQ16_26715 [Polyangiaceae bacterium]
MKRADGSVTTLATALPGAVALGVTSNHASVYEEQRRLATHSCARRRHGNQGAIAGDRYFVQVRRLDPFSHGGIITATLTDSTPPLEMIDPDAIPVVSWVGTSDTLYWTEGRRIYQRAIPVQ